MIIHMCMPLPEFRSKIYNIYRACVHGPGTGIGTTGTG